MIIKGRAIDAALRDPAPAYRGYLFYGRDEGRIRESAGTIARHIAPDLSDPFCVTDFSAAQLREDPALLADEAAALSMTGGRRVIRVRGASDANVPAFDGFLQNPSCGALVIAEAGDLAKKSKLRALFEAAKDGAAIACYEDSPADLEELIVAALRERGLRISADALVYLCNSLGDDRGTTRQELEKLALYKGPQSDGTPQQVELADVMACSGDLGSERFDDICHTAFGGDIEQLDTQLSRFFGAGESPVGLLRAASNHATRLQIAAAKIAAGMPVDGAVRALRPPVHFSRSGAFRIQLQLWDLRRLSQTLALLIEAEGDCKTTGLPDVAICSRTLLRIATAAQGARRQRS